MTFKRILILARGEKMRYIAAMIATCIAAACSLLSPQIVKVTVDSVLSNKPLEAIEIVKQLVSLLGGIGNLQNNLYLCGLALIIVSVAGGFFTYIKGWLSAEASESMAQKLKNSLYDRLQKVPYDYYAKAQTGDLIQRCTSDVDTIRKFLASQFTEVIRIVFLVITSIYIMSGIHVKMTLLSTIIIPVVLLFSIIFFILVKKAFKIADEKEGQLSTVLQENLSGVRVVRAFGKEKFETEKFEEKNLDFKNNVMRLISILAGYYSISDVFCHAQALVVLVAGIKYVSIGELTLGSFLLFTAYEAMLIWPVRGLGRILSDMGKMQVSLTRVYDILDTPEESDGENAQTPSLLGDISFKNLFFEYDPNKPVLKNISFDVKKGETIAILGTTGSGKSTLMHILLRLYDYRSGSIKINGVELRDISKKHLRREIGVVLQEPFLFSKTIIENIRMANYYALDTDIHDVAKTASIHSVIEGFENGYSTVVGEKGVTLSGGQKQRVAIARTLIKNSSMLIFDDSLSAVDTETDNQIRQALKDRNKDTTTFIISQRITTLMDADKIIVIENGKLSDIGTHDELINREGLYSRVWNIQNMLEDDFMEVGV